MNSTKRDGAARRGKRRMVAAVHTPPKAELNEDDPEVIAARLYNRFVDARIQMLTTPEPATSAYQASNEALWSAVADALNHQRSTGVALPQEMIFELESELRDWLSGTPSKRLPLLTRRGRSLAPVTRSCQLFAVMYLVASPQITGDRRARKTIKNQFFIVESTLQRWKNRFQAEAAAALKNFYSDWGSEERTKLLGALMETSARQYRRQTIAPKTHRITHPQPRVR